MALIGRWCHIVVLNVHAPKEHKINNVKDSFCEELERVFDKFPKYRMKLINSIWNKEEFPDQWKEYIIVTVTKGCQN
jgi:hypothetical protein